MLTLKKQDRGSQHLKKRKKRLPVSAYLAYLLIGTFVVSGVSFAKFAQTASESDTARAAAFVVSGSVSNSESTLDLDRENPASAEYTFTVTNANNGKVSEVALDYTIQVKLKEGAQLPTGVNMKLVDATGSSYEAHGNGNIYAFDGGFTLPAGSQETDSYTLQFSTEQGTQIGSDTSSICMDITAVVEQHD